MHLYKIFRALFLKIPTVLLLVALLVPAPAFSLDSEDSQIFISGFNSYQKSDYPAAVESMSTLLKKYPDTPLKDMAVFWLARANYKVGNNQEAGKYMAQFLRDYPESPLKATVEGELIRLAERTAAERGTAVKASAEKAAAEKADAANATAKLQSMGIESPVVKTGGAAAPQREVTQVFNIEVAQYADLDFRFGAAGEAQEAGKRFMIPMDIINSGNGSDSFLLESGFPPEYDFHFAAASTPDVAIKSTPTLEVGEKFRCLAVGTIPHGNIDGRKISYPVKVVSAFAREVSQTKELALRTSVPLFEAVLKSDKSKLLPGEKESFVSATSFVQRLSGVTARTGADRLVAIPGQTVSVPLVVTNTGNVREVFAIKASIPANATYTFYDDVNRDGKRQSSEPIINHVGPLSPKEEAYVVMEMETPASALDGAVAAASVRFEPEAADRAAAVNLQLTYSRPVVELTPAARGGKLKPGEVSSLDLNCVNRGSSPAKQVILQSALPAQLELVAAEPPFSRYNNGVYLWRLDELGAGERRSIKLTYRVKPGVAVGTNVQMKTSLIYHDLLGNRY
ncbi:MAG: outer membrane protein assembly factor BamD [Geobacter sp.]|nr:MAG: outer membrane protein assembly factor BamD [Geobacter sp.]